MRTILIIFLILPSHLFAASNSDIVSQITADYSAECTTEQKRINTNETDAIAAELSVLDENVYQMKITAGGKQATVLFADFSCPNVGASYWCGSSGCAVYIIVDGVSYQTRGWKPFSVTRGKEVLVILPKSGIACDQYNAAPCYAVTVWDESETTFNSIGLQLKN
tara:strand:- start:475 stop:969 length:495 start_codon:yes stop_codon:yes gene_type:complete